MTQKPEVDSKPTNNLVNLPAIKAASYEVDYSTPDVYWSQTKGSINMYIKLPNVENYNIKLLKSRMFNFE